MPKEKISGTRNGIREYHIRILHNSFYSTEKNPSKKRLEKTRETAIQSYQFFEQICIYWFFFWNIGNFWGLFLEFFPIFFWTDFFQYYRRSYGEYVYDIPESRFDS